MWISIRLCTGMAVFVYFLGARRSESATGKITSSILGGSARSPSRRDLGGVCLSICLLSDCLFVNPVRKCSLCMCSLCPVHSGAAMSLFVELGGEESSVSNTGNQRGGKVCLQRFPVVIRVRPLSNVHGLCGEVEICFSLIMFFSDAYE